MQTMWRQLLQLDRSESKTLQVQIREKIVEAILNGLIKPMQTMPSSRVLAKKDRIFNGIFQPISWE